MGSLPAAFVSAPPGSQYNTVWGGRVDCLQGLYGRASLPRRYTTCRLLPGRLALDLRQFGGAVLRRPLRLAGEFDGEALGDVGRHLRHDVRHGARIDLRRDLDQHVHVEPIEDFGGVARLHVLVKRNEAFEAGGLGLVFLHGLDLDAALDLLDLGEMRLDALLGGLDQVFADVELAGARVELFAALLQPFENGALGARRQRGALERNNAAIDRRWRLRRFGAGPGFRRASRGCAIAGRRRIGRRRAGDRTGDVAIAALGIRACKLGPVRRRWRGVDASGATRTVRKIEHLPRPGPGLTGLLRPIGRDADDRSATARALRCCVAGEPATAVEHEVGRLQDQQTDARDQGNRDETQIADEADHFELLPRVAGEQMEYPTPLMPRCRTPCCAAVPQTLAPQRRSPARPAAAAG